MTGILSLHHIQEAREIGMTPGTAIVQRVLMEVAQHSGVPMQVILGRGRLDQPVRARQLVMRAAYELGAQVEDIATVLHRDRTTVLHEIGARNGQRARRCRALPKGPKVDRSPDRAMWLRPFLRNRQPVPLSIADYTHRAAPMLNSTAGARLRTMWSEGLLRRDDSQTPAIYELTAAGLGAIS